MTYTYELLTEPDDDDPHRDAYDRMMAARELRAEIRAEGREAGE